MMYDGLCLNPVTKQEYAAWGSVFAIAAWGSFLLSLIKPLFPLSHRSYFEHNHVFILRNQ